MFVLKIPQQQRKIFGEHSRCFPFSSNSLKAKVQRRKKVWRWTWKLSRDSQPKWENFLLTFSFFLLKEWNVVRSVIWSAFWMKSLTFRQQRHLQSMAEFRPTSVLRALPMRFLYFWKLCIFQRQESDEALSKFKARFRCLFNCWPWNLFEKKIYSESRKSRSTYLFQFEWIEGIRGAFMEEGMLFWVWGAFKQTAQCFSLKKISLFKSSSFVWNFTSRVKIKQSFDVKLTKLLELAAQIEILLDNRVLTDGGGECFVFRRFHPQSIYLSRMWAERMQIHPLRTQFGAGREMENSFQAINCFITLQNHPF